jgi:hypothetical protein
MPKVQDLNFYSFMEEKRVAKSSSPMIEPRIEIKQTPKTLS